jgi:hypothetical protein
MNIRQAVWRRAGARVERHSTGVVDIAKVLRSGRTPHINCSPPAGRDLGQLPHKESLCKLWRSWYISVVVHRLKQLRLKRVW